VSAARHHHQHRRGRAAAYRRRQPWEDPAPVRAHLRHIRDQGGSYRAMAMAAGLPAPAVQALINGQERIDPATAAALLAVTAEDLDKPRVPADGTRLRLRSLMAMGHGYTRLARAAGTSPADIRKIIQGRAAGVTPQLHDRVRGVWEAWWDKTPPARTAAEGAAATKARVRARRGGWCTPLGLDEDLIDRPGYQPGHGWLPATGTGTAPDLEPPGQTRTGRPLSTRPRTPRRETSCPSTRFPARPANTRKAPRSGRRP
jgi:plasmid maintenance system antidote protein VapI